MRTGQMFIIAMIFLASLVFAVQEILLQYRDIQQPSAAGASDYYIIQNINDTLHSAFGSIVQCKSQQCMLFSGNGSIIFQSIPSFSNAFSIEGWFRPANIVQMSAARKQGSFFLGFGDAGPSVPSFGIWSSGILQRIDADTILDPGKFYHIIGTFNGTEERIYVNGVLHGRKAVAGSVDNPVTNMTIGSWLNGTGNQGFYGSIDDVLLYNSSLADSDALARYQHTGINATPAASWLFEEQPGINVKDYSGSFNGQMMGFMPGEGRIKAIDCDEATRKLKETDDLIKTASFGRYSVSLLYFGQAAPSLNCTAAGAGDILEVNADVISQNSETKADINIR